MATAHLLPVLYFLVLMALGLFAGYQVRGNYPVDVGGRFDGPYVGNFYAVEHNAQNTFRWTRDASVVRFPGAGADNYDLTLKVTGYRPEGTPPVLHVKVDGREIATVQTTGAPETLNLKIPAEDAASGDVKVRLETQTFRPAGDNRDLGVVVDSVTLAHSGSGPVFPAWGQILSLLLAAALMGLLASRLGASRRNSTLVALLFGAGLALLVAFARMWIAVFSGQMIQALVTSYIALVAMWLIVGIWFGRSQVKIRPVVRNGLFAVFTAVFFVRLAGQLYPQIYIMDVMFHVHRLEQVMGGDLFFTIQSGEWGGRQTFYLPTAYLFLAPFGGFVDRVFLVKIFTILMDTSAIFLVFFVVWRVLKDTRAALLSAVVYAVIPMSYLVFSWGITSNLFGQWLALAVLAILATVFDKLNRWPIFILLAAALLLGFLSHPGAVLLLAGAMVFFVLVYTLIRRRPRLERGTVMLVLAGVLAVGAAFGGYYVRFVGTMTHEAAAMAEQRQQTAQAENHGRVFYVGGSVTDVSLDLRPHQVYSFRELAVEAPKGLYHEAKAFYKYWPLGGLFLGVALLFVERRRTQLPWLLTAWVLSAAAFGLVGMFSGTFVRYMLFLLPIAAIGSGIFLGRIFRQQWAGQAVTLMLVGYLLWSSMSLWYDRVMYAFH